MKTLDHQSPHAHLACDLDYVACQACRAEVNVALSNSFGFEALDVTLMYGSFQ